MVCSISIQLLHYALSATTLLPLYLNLYTLIFSKMFSLSYCNKAMLHYQEREEMITHLLKLLVSHHLSSFLQY